MKKWFCKALILIDFAMAWLQERAGGAILLLWCLTLVTIWLSPVLDYPIAWLIGERMIKAENATDRKILRLEREFRRVSDRVVKNYQVVKKWEQ